MQVYIYNSGDGDTAAFSTLEKAWAFAQTQGWATILQEDDTTWTIRDSDTSVGDISLCEIDSHS